MTSDKYLEGLSWLHDEIVQSLDASVDELAIYQESRQTECLDRCQEQFHRVLGSLEVAGCKAGAQLVAEMLRTIGTLRAKPAAVDEGCAVLAEAIDTLPRYLARLQQGEEGHPAILMTLLNDLRAVQGEPLFSETDAFAPDLSPLNAVAAPPSPESPEEWRARIQKLCHFYQVQLIPLLKGEPQQDQLRQLSKVIDPVEALFSRSNREHLWRAAGGFFEALLSGRVPLGCAARSLLRGLERELRLAAEQGHSLRGEAAPVGLVRNLLFYVALAGSGGLRRELLWREFHLGESLPAAMDREQDIALDDSVVAALAGNFGTEVASIKTALEEYLADDCISADPLRDAVQVAHRMAVSLTIAGQLELRALCRNVEALLESVIATESEHPERNLLDRLAVAIVDLEAGLHNWAAGARQRTMDDGQVGQSLTVTSARHQLMEEITREFDDLKNAVLDHLDTGEVALPDAFEGSLTHLATVLQIAEMPRCAEVVSSLRGVSGRPVKGAQLNTLADVLIGIERYLENCLAGRERHDASLSWAEEALATLLAHEQAVEGPVEVFEAPQEPHQPEWPGGEMPAAASIEQDPATEAGILPDFADTSFMYTVFAPGDQPEFEVAADGLQVPAEEEVPPGDSEWQTGLSIEHEAAGQIESDAVPALVVESELTAGSEAVSEPESAFDAEFIIDFRGEEASVHDLLDDSQDTGDFAGSLDEMASAAQEVHESDDDPDDGVGDDLKEIFVEEAREVLETLGESYPRWQADVGDRSALADTRRCFHTLKGSGRMVGAFVIGEFAWAMENLLNRVIDRRIAPSQGLYDCVDEAIARLPGLITAFEQNQSVTTAEVEALQARAEALARGEWQEDAASVSREPLQQAAEAACEFSEEDRELREIFLAEARTHLEVVRRFISDQRDRCPLYTPPGAMVQSALHTLKGSTHMAGIESLAQLVTAMERLSRDLLTTRTPVDDESLGLLDDGSAFIDGVLQALVSGHGAGMADQRLDDLLARSEKCRSRVLSSVSAGASVGTESPTDRLLHALMRDGLDQLMSMEQWLQDWRGNPEFDRGRFELLSEELAGAAAHAAGAGCPPIEDLASALQGTCRRLTHWPGEAGDEWVDTILQARESLLGMCDALAAHQEMPWATEKLLASLAGIGVVRRNAREVADSLRERLAVLSLPDDADIEIVELFLTEADELLETMEHSFHEWREDTAGKVHPETLKRALHTFKGGARMASLDVLADVSHELESEVESSETTVASGEIGPITTMLAFHDALVSGVDQVRAQVRIAAAPANTSEDQPGVKPSAQAEPARPEEDTWPTAEIIPFAGMHRGLEDAAPTTEQTASVSQEAVRLAAPVLDMLVNLVGEASISRGQVEQHVNEFMFSLDEMEATIRRMHDQVRRLGIETDAQVMFRREQIEASDGSDGFDPLEMDRYSQLQQLSRSLLESASDLQDLRDTLVDKSRDAETLLLHQSRINTDLQESLMRTRMVPFSRMVPRLRRIVRQVAGTLGKQVSLQLESVEGELDRTILERIVPALEHMVRNAIDHGIESAEERAAVGKIAEGTLSVSLAREGGDVLIRLADDGRGLDVDAIRAKAIANGLMAESAILSDHEIQQFIFASGFSTSRAITEVSGRGVGMDVVNSEVRQLGGSVSISSQRGAGTEFTLRLPFTLSINRALMIGVGEDSYALPLNTITGVTRIAVDDLLHFYQNPGDTFHYGGEDYQVRYLGSLLSPDIRPMLDTALGRQLPAVLMRSEGRNYAVQVDGLDGSREIVVKTLGAQFSRVPGLSGATVLGDGRVVVILDLQALLREQIAVPMPAPVVAEPVYEAPADHVPTVMVVDDSVTVRKVTSRFLEREGFNVLTAKDGIDAMRMLQDHTPDIMLLDIEMPRMDGFEVTRLVRSTQRLKHLPIVMITSRTGEKHRERALSMGADNYLGKPYQEEVLIDVVRGLLERGRVSASGGQAG